MTHVFNINRFANACTDETGELSRVTAAHQGDVVRTVLSFRREIVEATPCFCGVTATTRNRSSMVSIYVTSRPTGVGVVVVFNLIFDIDSAT